MLSLFEQNRFAYAGIEGLSSNKNYKFRVIAENVYGRSKPSEEISIKTVSENEGRQRLGLAPEGAFELLRIQIILKAIWIYI